MDAVIVDLFEDVVCPWCWLGDRRLQAAIEMRPDVPVVVRRHAFQLDPTIPAEGIARRDYVVAKFGSEDALGPAHERLSALGDAEGVPFHFERITRSPNTRDAHRLIALSAGAAPEAQAVLAERLFQAYFSEGRDVGDHETLVELAADVGLDEGSVRAALASDAGGAAVDQSLQACQQLGIRGVPFYIFHGKYGVSGAQEPAALAEVIDRVVAEREQDSKA